MKIIVNRAPFKTVIIGILLLLFCLSNWNAHAHEGCCDPCIEIFYEGTDSAYIDTLCLHFHAGEFEEIDPISAILGGESTNGANFRGAGILSIDGGDCLPPIDNACNGCDFENPALLNVQNWKLGIQRWGDKTGSFFTCIDDNLPYVVLNDINQISLAGYFDFVNGVNTNQFINTVPYSDFYDGLSINNNINPSIASLFGNNVIRLGRTQVSFSSVVSLIKGVEIVSNNPNNPNYLTFDYAAHFNANNHDFFSSPRFRILLFRERNGQIEELLNNEINRIDLGLGLNEVSELNSEFSVLNFITTNSYSSPFFPWVQTVSYLDWSCGRIDLSIKDEDESIQDGDIIYILFEVRGCNANLDHGILYLDNLQFSNNGVSSGICGLADPNSFVRYDAEISGHSPCAENALKNICFDFQLPVAEFNNQTSITGSITVTDFKLTFNNTDVTFIEDGSIFSLPFNNFTLDESTTNNPCLEIPDNMFNHAYIRDDDAQPSDEIEILVHNNITYRKINLNEGYRIEYSVVDKIDNTYPRSYLQSDNIEASFVGTSLTKNLLTINNDLSSENINCQEDTPNLIALEAKNIQNMISNHISNNNTFILQEKINEGVWSNLPEFDWSPIMNGSKYQTMLTNKNFIPLSCPADCNNEFFYYTQYTYRLLLCNNDSLIYSNEVTYNAYPPFSENNYYNVENCGNDNIPHDIIHPCMGGENGSIKIDVDCIVGGKDDYTFTLQKGDIASSYFDENDCNTTLVDGLRAFRRDGLLPFENLAAGVYRLTIKTPCNKPVRFPIRNRNQSTAYMETHLDFELVMNSTFTVELDPVQYWCEGANYVLEVTVQPDHDGFNFIFDREDPLNEYTNKVTDEPNKLELLPFLCNGGVHKITIINSDNTCRVTKEVFVVDFNPPAIQIPKYEEVLAINAIKYKSAWLHEFSDMIFDDYDDLIKMQDRNPYATGQVGIYKPYQQYDYLDVRREFTKKEDGSTLSNPFDNKPEAYLQTDGVIGTPNNGKTIAKSFVWNHPALDSDCLPEWQYNNEFTLYNTNGNNIENKDLLDRYTASLYTHDGMLATAVATNAQQNEIAFENFELFNTEVNQIKNFEIQINSDTTTLGCESVCYALDYISQFCFPNLYTLNLKRTLFDYTFDASRDIEINMSIDPKKLDLNIAPSPLFTRTVQYIEDYIKDKFKFKFELFYDETPIYSTNEFSYKDVNVINPILPDRKIYKNKKLKGVISVHVDNDKEWQKLSIINSGYANFSIPDGFIDIEITYEEGSNEYNILNNPPSNFDFVNKNIEAKKAYLTPYKVLKGFGNYAIIDRPYSEFCANFGDEEFSPEITIDFAAKGLEFHCREVPNIPLEVVGKNQTVTIEENPCVQIGGADYGNTTMIVFKDNSMPGFPTETDNLGYTYNSTMYWDGFIYEKRILTIGETAKNENRASFTNEKAHSGEVSLKIPETIGEDDKIIFEHPDIKLIGGKTYLLSAWISTEYLKASPPNLLIQEHYNNKVGIYLSIGSMPAILFVPTGNVIEGWQKLEVEFKAPDKPGILSTHFMPLVEMYIDDIRIHPVDASMESYVYDPQTLRLEAVLDQNNYATFYKYDDEGSLFNISKETVHGIKTLQISTNFIKEN
jgi:hypothetical protein